MIKDKQKPTGKEQVNLDELNGIESIPIPNEYLLQCQKCKTYYDKNNPHKCKEVGFWSSVCTICNRDLYKWVKLPNGFSKHETIHKNIRIWNKPICEGCIIQANKELQTIK